MENSVRADRAGFFAPGQGRGALTKGVPAIEMTTDDGRSTVDVTHRIYERTVDEDATARDATAAAGCPECDGTVVTNTAETVCADCGLVLAAQPVDRRPTWGHDDPDRSRRRTGAPRTVARHDDGLTTEIGRGRDGKGRALSGRKRTQLGRLRREHRRARFRSKAERNLAHGLSDIRRLADRVACSRATRDRACVLFRRAHGDGLCLGRSIEMLAGGALYAACREQAELRTLGEVASASACDRAQVRHGYQVLCAEYDLAVPPYPLHEYVVRVRSRVDLADRAAARALELGDIAQEVGLVNGCSRAGMAAACVYRAGCEQPPTPTQASCAAAAGTSATTLRTRLEDLAAVIE